MVTIAHRVDVEVGADGHASAPSMRPPPLHRRRAHDGKLSKEYLVLKKSIGLAERKILTLE
jgi:hypothetical protein